VASCTKEAVLILASELKSVVVFGQGPHEFHKA